MPHLSDDESRNRFLKGTYMVLAIHWGIITLCSLLPLWSQNLRIFLQDQNETFVIMGVYLGVIVCITACFGLHRKVPWNLGALAVFTLAWILVIPTVTAASESYGAIFVFGTLTVAALFISLVSCVERWNALSWTSVLVIMVSVIGSHLVLYRYSKESPELVSVSLGLCVLSILYLLADSVSIMGRSNLKLEDDEYVFGAMTLYLDLLVRTTDWISGRCCRCLQ
ncbi:protein lifeguard 2-like [Galendromus occidentalis]|uniref:Protein lifeguard 2-like n=1 Tax=Galendromus occidentalis TaxID=34638 RepID=A0AAJ6QN92_9ACAR|nr:protein lifeguard 2-like [Galendromus occidentalis]